MSILALHTPNHTNLITIGASHSYCFYQELSLNSSSSFRQPKQIIPSIPRQHFKAPKNSSLSPIRKQKVMPKNDDEPLIIQRPYPLLTTFSSPASLQSTKKRQRKVSFNKKVVVVCTIFDEEDESDNEVPVIRRHSTGETNLKSILTSDQKNQPLLTQKITKTLKQFKNRLLFVN